MSRKADSVWQKRGSETVVSTATTCRLKKQRSYASTSRSKEGDDQRRVRLTSMRERARQKIVQETESEREASLHVADVSTRARHFKGYTGRRRVKRRLDQLI